MQTVEGGLAAYTATDSNQVKMLARHEKQITRYVCVFMVSAVATTFSSILLIILTSCWFDLKARLKFQIEESR